jgi:predicted lipid-binding transport protein (Tim44 family)
MDNGSAETFYTLGGLAMLRAPAPHRKLLLILIIFLVILTICMPLAARAGGAGGGSSSSSSGSSSGGGDGDGIFLLIYFVMTTVPFPFNIIILLVAGFILFKAGKKGRQSSPVNHIPEPGDTVKSGRGYREFRQRHPDFDESAFLAKVHGAFVTIQEGWARQDLGDARRYLSDGVYQRFTAQFQMMKLLEQKNILESLMVHNLAIEDVRTDGVFDVITVAVHASIKDKFESSLFKKLNSGGHEEFVEYWSFLRKRVPDEAKADLYSTHKCPSCGGELPRNTGDVSRCPFCRRLSNTGEYDWVLSEITQADDWAAQRRRGADPEKLAEKLGVLSEENEDFSVQLLEDRASNGFLRILQARVTGETDKVRRFVDAGLFDELSSRAVETGVVYNRLYLNSLTLMAVGRKEGKDILAFSVKYTFQRVRPDGKTVKILDPSLVSRTEIVLMERDSAVFRPSGSVYSWSCPSCGGELADTTDTSCRYCGEPLNSTRFDWVITSLMGLEQWREYRGNNRQAFSYTAEPDLLNSLYKVRDFALNNVLVMIAVDGVFEKEEVEFTETLARRWGYDKTRLQGLMSMAAAGRISLRMPEEDKERRKICRLMKKAAESDKNISSLEQDLLDYVEKSFCAG